MQFNVEIMSSESCVTSCDLNKRALQSDTAQSLVVEKLHNVEIFSMQVATIRQSEAVFRLLSLGIKNS